MNDVDVWISQTFLIAVPHCFFYLPPRPPPLFPLCPLFHPVLFALHDLDCRTVIYDEHPHQQQCSLPLLSCHGHHCVRLREWVHMSSILYVQKQLFCEMFWPCLPRHPIVLTLSLVLFSMKLLEQLGDQHWSNPSRHQCQPKTNPHSPCYHCSSHCCCYYYCCCCCYCCYCCCYFLWALGSWAHFHEHSMVFLNHNQYLLEI